MQRQLKPFRFHPNVLLLAGWALFSLLQPTLTTTSQFQQGIKLYQQRNYQEAEATFRKVIERDHDHADAYYHLGLVLSQQGKFEQAIAAYRQSLEFTSSDAKRYSIYYDLGDALYEFNQYDEASPLTRKLLNSIRLMPKPTLP